jgi:mitochondrial-processing peptidase subunit alpha
VKAELEEAAANPQGVLLEAIHSAGFSGALANPLIAPESAISRLDANILEEFVNVSHFELASATVSRF